MKKINLGQKDLIHFVGIGGIGMSGLAQIMKTMGFNVQGSDLHKNKNTESTYSLLPWLYCKLAVKLIHHHQMI